MRIAIDGSLLLLPPSGVATYLRALTEALIGAAPDLDLQIIQPDWSAPRPGAPLLARLRRNRRLQRGSWDLIGVARAASRARADLLHVPHLAAPLRPSAPFVVTIHDTIPFDLPAYRASPWMRLHLAAARRFVRGARLVVTPSRSAASDVARALRIPPDRIRVTPEAAGPEFRPASDREAARAVARRLGVDGRYVFNVGGFDVRKNLPALIEAFALLRARSDEPLSLVIAGAPHTDNPRVYPPLQPLVDQLGLGRAVVFPGRIGEADKLALYQGADLYVTPSLHEGFGLTALEAMACGVPTIAANRTSLPEVVGDGGLLVEPEPGALASAMVSVLTDAEMAARLARSAVERARAFSWEETARLTLDVYREATTRGGTADHA